MLHGMGFTMAVLIHTNPIMLIWLRAGRLIQQQETPTGGDAYQIANCKIYPMLSLNIMSYEIGYKGVIATKLLVDLNYYYTSINNFLGGAIRYWEKFHHHQGKTSRCRDGVVSLCEFSLHPHHTRCWPWLGYSLPMNFCSEWKL